MQRDYMLRMIEQMAATIARLRKMIVGGADGADIELREAAGMYDVDLRTARAVDGETLLLLLSPTGEPEPGRCWITAELMYLDALSLERDGNMDEAAHGFAKALLLYETIDATMLGGLPEANERIAELRLRMSDG
jgi:hypothetical protein